jgi:hypothetical protein
MSESIFESIEIRKVKNALAFAFDELGNITTLTTDLRVIQH